AETAFPDGLPKPKDEKAAKDAADKDKTDKGAAPAGDAAKSAGDKDSTPPVPPQLKTAAQPINVIVVADTDILDDRFWVQVQDFFGQRVAVPNAGNGDFVANAIEVLAGGNDLISLRSRGTSARPFEVVQNIQRAANHRYSAQEHTLEEKLKATQGKISDLRNDKNGYVVLTADQTKAIDNFKSEMLQT